ncbi:MAG: hypothetical protein JNL66_18455 [Alphaproteobacteria bacterium]|nr:hypothetical protein [Alphaproteobacteria bacterium]
MSNVSQFGIRIDVLSRAGNFVAALDVFADLTAAIRARPSNTAALAALERATSRITDDALRARDLDALISLYRACDTLFSAAATNDEIGLALGIAAIGLADGLNAAGRPDDIDPIVARLSDINLGESADRALTVRFGHVLFAQIRAYYDVGNVDRARTLVMEYRRTVLSPAFLADLSARFGHDAGRKWNRLCGAMIYALAQAHTQNPRWPFKTIEERFDFAATKRVELWGGALAIDIPAIWSTAASKDEPTLVTCWAKGFEAGHFHIQTADMLQMADGMDLSPVEESQNDGTFSRYDQLEGYDWLVERSMILARGGRSGRMVMINLTLVTLALYDERDDFQGLVAQLETAVSRMTVDVDRLPRSVD